MLYPHSLHVFSIKKPSKNQVIFCQEQFVDRGAALDYGRYCFHNCVPTVMINGFLASEKAVGLEDVSHQRMVVCMVNVPTFGWFFIVNVGK